MSEQRIAEALREATDTEAVAHRRRRSDSVADVFARTFGDRAGGRRRRREHLRSRAGRTVQERSTRPGAS